MSHSSNPSPSDCSAVSDSLCGLAQYFFEASEQQEQLLLDERALASLSYLLCQLALRALELEENALEENHEQRSH